MTPILIVEHKTLAREAWKTFFKNVSCIQVVGAVRAWSNVDVFLDEIECVFTTCDTLHRKMTSDLLWQKAQTGKVRIVSLGCTTGCVEKESCSIYPVSEEDSPEILLNAVGVIEKIEFAVNSSSRFQQLTESEKEVVRRLIHGESYKEIAVGMELSASTVQSYRERAMAKLEVTHLADLVVLGAANKIRSCPCRNNNYQI